MAPRTRIAGARRSRRNTSTTSSIVPVVDLTDIPESDDDNDEKVNEVANSVSWLSNCPITLSKVCHSKKIRKSKLKLIRDALPEHVHESLFSAESKAHLKELEQTCKTTNVDYSINPYFMRALFAGVKIKKGGFITLYFGERMPYNVCHAAQARGRPSTFAVSLPHFVVIDGLGYPYGAGMANHSCRPNAKLEFGFLRGSERAPYAFLKALKDIEIGDEIECDYGYLDKYTDEQLQLALETGRFIPCRCLKPECCKIFIPNIP